MNARDLSHHERLLALGYKIIYNISYQRFERASIDDALEELIGVEFFFCDDDLPEDRDSGQIYINELERLRGLAFERPLSLPHDLVVLDSWSHSCAQKTDRVPSHRYRDPLVNDVHLSDSSNFAITLRSAIRAKLDVLSQVYRGHLRVGSA